MPRSPEDMERMKRIALTGAALAAAGLAMRYRKPMGDRVNSAEIWEKSGSVVLDLIKGGKEKSIRLSGKLIRGINNEITDVEDIELIGDDGTEDVLEHLESAFPGSSENT